MKTLTVYRNCWRWLLPTLAILLAPSAMAQGTIVYVHAPLSNPDGDPNHFYYDSLGTQVGPDFPIVINGQTALTFFTPKVLGQPSSFVVQASSTSAIIGQEPFPNNGWAVPLLAGTEIGPNADGYSWFGGGLLTASIGSHTEGDPFLTIGYFTGVESAYLGFQFQQNSETYYGWVRLGCPAVGLNVGWIYDYAYETTPNTPIFAGAVPELSSWALLAVGSFAIWFFRRR